LPSFVEALLVVLEELFLALLVELELEEARDFLVQQLTVLVDFQAKVESVLALVALVVLVQHFQEQQDFQLVGLKVVLLTKQEY
jgi:hypothetical protein